MAALIILAAGARCDLVRLRCVAQLCLFIYSINELSLTPVSLLTPQTGCWPLWFWRINTLFPESRKVGLGSYRGASGEPQRRSALLLGAAAGYGSNSQDLITRIWYPRLGSPRMWPGFGLQDLASRIWHPRPGADS